MRSSALFSLTKAVILFLFSFSIVQFVSAQNAVARFSGQVLDEDGRPIRAATINEKGAARYTTSDARGNFYISSTDLVKTLIITCTGYLPQEINALNNKAIVVHMQPAYRSGAEVIVTGYGKTARKKLTTSTVKVKGEDLEKTNFASVEQALQGQAAGVSVVANDGNPGGKFNVRIRGYSSASADGNNDPLYVIDGVPTRGNSNIIALLSSGNIESVDILKDASATAIYGIQASNGVIVITTKKGKLNSKLNFTLNTYAGIASAWKKLDVLNPQEYAKFVQQQIDNTNEIGPIVGYPFYVIDSFLMIPSSLPQKGTDWQKLIFNNGKLFDINLNANGGSDKTTYSFGLGYRKQEGILINSNLNRYNFQAGFNHQLNNRINFGADFSYNYAEKNGVPYNYIYGTSLTHAILYPNLFPSKSPDGNYQLLPKSTRLYSEAVHPVALSQSLYSPNRETGIWGSVFTDVKILKNLVFHSQFGYNRFTSQAKGSSEPALRDSVTTSQESIISGRSIYLAQSASQSTNWDNYLTYYFKFARKNNVTLTTGTVKQSSYEEGFSISQLGFNLFDRRYRYIGLGNTPVALSQTEFRTEKSQFSYFGRLNYDYAGKYLLQFSVRRDGSSVFSNTNNKFATFPAFSASWRISEENFMAGNTKKTISELKLRGSWGKTGNDIVGDNYAGYSRLGSGYGFSFGGNILPGTALSAIGNKNLQWETITQTDIGLDATLFNKLDITIDWYKRINDNMLIRSPVAGTLGLVAAPAANVGSMQNTGLEMAINFRSKIGKDLNISVGANGSILKNRVLSLGKNVAYLLPRERTYATQDFVSRTIPGQPLSVFYGYQFDGIYQSQKEVDDGPVYDFTDKSILRPGDMRLKDINGDGAVTADDKVILGSPIPKFTWGANLRLDYKNFDFSALVNGSHGNKIYSDVYNTLMSRTYAGNKLGDFRDSWTPDHLSNKTPRPSYEVSAIQQQVSSWYVFDGSFVRVRNIIAGFTLHAKWFDKAGITAARVYVNIQNPFTFTKYWGWDPEIGGNEDSNPNRDVYLGVDFGAYPQARTYSFGLNLSF
jgi:TonB-dependent starch-binding outer membrane protein SusC